MTIAVLGGGAWGTALAVLLVDNGHPVTLWTRDPAAAADMQSRRENARYLPGRRFPDSLTVTADLTQATANAPVIVLALPSVSLRETAARIAGFSGLAVCASKGIESHTHLTLDHVLGACWPAARVALLSGPTFAVELGRGLPAAAVAASTDPAAAEAVRDLLSSERFRIYTSQDTVGVAIGGALKNVIAIAAGCSDGLGFGNNARAALITRGLHEMGRLVARLGGDPLTLAGLAGLGDLVLTCTGELSRNRTVGLALARGEPLGAVVTRLGQVAEGVETATTAAALSSQLNVDMPITQRVAAVLAGEITARQAVAALLAREPRPERA